MKIICIKYSYWSSDCLQCIIFIGYLKVYNCLQQRQFTLALNRPLRVHILKKTTNAMLVIFIPIILIAYFIYSKKQAWRQRRYFVDSPFIKNHYDKYNRVLRIMNKRKDNISSLTQTETVNIHRIYIRVVLQRIHKRVLTARNMCILPNEQAVCRRSTRKRKDLLGGL